MWFISMNSLQTETQLEQNWCASVPARGSLILLCLPWVLDGFFGTCMLWILIYICGDLRFHCIIGHVFPVDPLRDLNAGHTGQSGGLIRENKTNLYTSAAVHIRNINGNHYRNQLHIIYIQCLHKRVHNHQMYEGK